MKIFSKRILALSIAAVAAGAVLADFDGPAPLAWRWAEPTSAAPSGAPITDGQNVYVAVAGRIYGIDPVSGNEIWRYPAGVPVEGNFRTGLVKTGDTIIAAADNKSVFAVNAKTGELLWTYASPDMVVGTPVATTTAVVFPTAVDTLIAVDLKTGEPSWTQPLKVANGLQREIAAWQNYVIFATRNGDMQALDVATQRARWNIKFGRINAASGPVMQGDNFYVASSSYIYCMAASTGRSRWRATVTDQTVFSPAVSEQGVAVVTQRGQMFSFDANGRPRFRGGIDLKSSPVASPAFAGKLVVTPTSNGAISAVDPLTGDLVWTYTVPPLTIGAKANTPSGNSGGSGPGASGAAAGGDGGGAGAASGGAPTGPTAGGQSTGTGPDLKFILAAGPVVVQGDSLFVLTVDGSLLAFDKKNGVDLTPPTAELLWPHAGDQVAGKAPMQMIFQLKDLGSGINADTVKMTINNQPVVADFDKDGYLRFTISSGGSNRQLPNGRANIVITATDWMGNTMNARFMVMIDNSLNALGGPPTTSTGN